MKNYPIKVFKIETDNGIEWVAEYPDLKGCVGGGGTPAEAVMEAEENKLLYLDTLLIMGKEIPEPKVQKQSKASGKLSLRISKSTHEDLAKSAHEEGISINQFVVEAISEKIGTVKTATYLRETILKIEESMKFKYDANPIKINKNRQYNKLTGGGYYGNYQC